MDYWQNEQFEEDDDERAERLRASRHRGRCAICGRNPKLGQEHQADCTYATAPDSTRTPEKS